MSVFDYDPPPEKRKAWFIFLAIIAAVFAVIVVWLLMSGSTPQVIQPKLLSPTTEYSN